MNSYHDVQGRPQTLDVNDGDDIANLFESNVNKVRLYGNNTTKRSEVL
jgi:hypothetical protein